VEVYRFCPKTYFGANTYVVISENEAAVVDPSVDFSEASSVLAEVSVKYIFLTHCHFDHILRLDEWVRKTGAEVIIGEYDRGGLSSPITNCYSLFLGEERGYFGRVRGVCDGDRLSFGEIEVSVISTPGHTVGGVCYLADGALFAGDTVFSGGSYGRCDLPGGDEEALFSSISKLCELPDDTLVYLGHGDSACVAEIKRYFK